MKFGYVICDSASINVYYDAVRFLIDELGCVSQNDELHDVDDSIWQTFKRGNANIKLESDTQINYVAIISDEELPLECLHEFKAA